MTCDPTRFRGTALRGRKTWVKLISTNIAPLRGGKKDFGEAVPRFLGGLIFVED
jgi:hypothetical protein